MNSTEQKNFIAFMIVIEKNYPDHSIFSVEVGSGKPRWNFFINPSGRSG